MKTVEEIRADCAEALRQLRIQNGYTKAEMCIAANVDIRTWNKYESGESAPDVAKFLYIFAALGKDAMHTVLHIVYPETYADLSPEDETQRFRETAAHYILNAASDRTVRELNFLIHGQHGSNIEPQMQEFTMLDHLPMAYRYAIAEMIYTFWRLAESRGELVRTDRIMPDIDVFLAGLTQGQEAANDHRDSYTTGVNHQK